MDYRFDSSKLLKIHQQEQKNPPQLESVAGGVTERFQENEVKDTMQPSSVPEDASFKPVMTNEMERPNLTPAKTQGSRARSNKTPSRSVMKATSHLKPIPKHESSLEERLRSPRSSSDEPSTSVHTLKISPYVTISRGKDNARREMKKKIDLGLLDEDFCNTDQVFVFRKQLSGETKRLAEMCEMWDAMSEQAVLPESVQGEVRECVGQARLLISQKLEQFTSLMEQCLRPEPGAALVTPADLCGFWDMVFEQILKVDMRFKKLEELWSCGWVKQQPLKPKKAVSKSKVNANTKPEGGPSQLEEMRAAVRKANKDQEHSQMSPAPAPLAISDKTLEAGFFSMRSPIKSPAAADHTPVKNNSPLKPVLSNEAGKASVSKVPDMTESRLVNIQKTEEKENSKGKSKIKRQAAVDIGPKDRSPVMTRSRRKRMNAPEALTPRK